MCAGKNPDRVVPRAAEEKGLGGVWGRTGPAELWRQSWGAELGLWGSRR